SDPAPSDPAPSDAGRAGPARALPPGCVRLLAHVRATRPGVDHLLAGLLGSTVVVPGGWRPALQASIDHPDLVVVTPSGARFERRGWHVGRPGEGATGAALAEAQLRAGTSAADLAAAEEASTAARQELGAARAARVEAVQVDASTRDAVSRATEALSRVEAAQAELRAQTESVASHLTSFQGRAERDRTELTELEHRLPVAEAMEAASAERERRIGEVREDLARRAGALRARRNDVEVAAAGLSGRRELLTRRLAEIEERLSGAAQARADASRRRRDLERAGRATSGLASVVAASLGRLDAEVTELGDRRRQRRQVLEESSASLARLRGERSSLEGDLVALQERSQRVEIERAEARLRGEAAVEAVRRDLDAEPEEALCAPCPELPPGATAGQRGRELDRELRLMGPVNPLAVAELEALEERAGFLDGQLEDVRAARRELAKVIRAIDGEIVGVFAEAYADVARHFSDLVTTLFPGGSGSLSLTDPTDLLDTGIEVMARPAGKNVRKLSLLSGGERSLVALAFLCAVFRSRPSPFYLMDEVEAALDDVNLHRFLDLVSEFRNDAQLIVVSHQKRTMEVADSLYGVTMQPGGSSRVVSERVPRTPARAQPA
ncbi:MAG: hypothetical protein ACRD0J_08020, partial [Acidimicrobiales bacterium]